MGWIVAAFTGLVAGMVHVLSGPDHLVAVLPFAVDRPARALRVGLFWGLGHGLGVLVLGLVFLAAQAYFDLDAISQAAEVLVGLLLIGVGLWALRRSRKLVLHTHAHDHDGDGHAHPHVHLDDPTVDDATHPSQGRHAKHSHSTLGFGFIHGVAGMGHLVGAGPLVALSGAAAGAYLVAYLAGGVVAMTAFAALAGQMIRRPRWVPRGLATAGVLSMGVGLFWVASFALA